MLLSMMLPTANRRFLGAYALKTVSVGNYDCSFMTDNLKILKWFLLKVLLKQMPNFKFIFHRNKQYKIRKIAKSNYNRTILRDMKT